MTFPVLEESRQLGSPISLYFIRYGSGVDNWFAYTSAEQAVEYTYDDPVLGPIDVVFSPIPIQRSNIVSSGALDKATLTVRLPIGSPLGQFFNRGAPSQQTALTIMDGHHGSDDYRIVWIGRILGSANEGRETVYTCEPASTSMKRVGLRRNYQHLCPHVLYGPSCKAVKELGVTGVGGIIGSVSGAVITLASPSFDPGMNIGRLYVNGLMEWTTEDGRFEVRSIIKVSEDELTLIVSSPVYTLGNGDWVELYLGCSHETEICEGLFHNIHNFGGQPYIPTRNPLGIRNNFD